MNMISHPNTSSIVNGIRSVYWVVGSFIILFAGISLVTQMSLAEIMALANRHFGKTFSVLYLLLVISGLYSIQRLWISSKDNKYWSEMGLQAANGISTLALTFTLFGISMGIGSLSDQPLSQENVEGVISELTAQFSIAFMTTVIGLPTAALLRAIISVRLAKHEIKGEA